MNCSPFDLKDYFLKELTGPQQRQVEDHVAQCAECRQEMERLRLTGAALVSLGEEEIPQRIAFVSDPVFEPSGWRRGWAAFWNSSARLGFAAAAVLSVAILVSALTRPGSAPVAPHVTTAAAYYTRAEVDQRIQSAVAASETRTTQQVKDLVQRADQANNQRLIAESQTDYIQKQYYSLLRATGSYVLKASSRGESR